MPVDLEAIERSVVASESHVAECSGSCCLCGLEHHICEPFADTIRELIAEVAELRAALAEDELQGVAAEAAKIRAIVETSDSYVPQDVAAACLLALAPLDRPGKPNTLSALVDRAMEVIATSCGPICPIDQHYAVEHIPFGQPHTIFRSWAEPSPWVKHPYEECFDCDAMSSYHHEGVEHCGRCYELPDECDGTPLIGGVVPSHPAWREGEAWWQERRKP